MKVGIFANSQKPIGPLIEGLIVQAHDIFIASAYISRKAVDALVKRLPVSYGGHPSRVDILFGIDLETDTVALEYLADACKRFPEFLQVRYTPNKSGKLFHPKIYSFQCGQISHILIASANLTQRGHYVNEEMYCYIECSTSDSIVKQLDVIRKFWLAEPFSVPLDEQVIGLKNTIDKATAAFKNIFADTGRIGKPGEMTPSDAKERLLVELNRGYLVSTDFSVAPLSVPIPIRDGDGVKAGNGNAVMVRSSLTAWVQLLPDKICGEFSALNREARRVVEQHAILVPPGVFYIPASAHKSFTAAMRALISQHKQLINKYIRLKTPMNSYLAQELRKGCADAWQRHREQIGILSENEIYEAAQVRIKERREDFSHNPHSAVRLVINPFPHPLLSRAQEPNHPAWVLRDVNADDDLLATIIAILLRQVDAVIEATKKKQQPAVQEDFKRAKLLVSIRSEKINKFLTILARLAGKDWVKARKHRKPNSTTPGKLMVLELSKLYKQVKDHRDWLESVKRKKPEEAFELLLQEYPTIGSPSG